MRRSVQVLLVDPDAGFQTLFKREVEELGSVEVATCSLGRKAALLAEFIQFDAVFANAAVQLPYDTVSSNIRRQLADAVFYVYGHGVVQQGSFQPLAPESAIDTAKEVVRSYS
ncbi:MAG TPA: hypothetical protein VGB12_01220 [bacterium]|jgi:hypothetical protein